MPSSWSNFPLFNLLENHQVQNIIEDCKRIWYCIIFRIMYLTYFCILIGCPVKQSNASCACNRMGYVCVSQGTLRCKRGWNESHLCTSLARTRLMSSIHVYVRESRPYAKSKYGRLHQRFAYVLSATEPVVIMKQCLFIFIILTSLGWWITLKHS